MKLYLDRTEKIELLKAIQTGFFDTAKFARITTEIRNENNDFEFPVLDETDFKELIAKTNEQRKRNGKEPLAIIIK